MPSITDLYPATPLNVAATATETSKAFKKEVGNTMGSIILFLVVYVLLFMLSIGLIIACIYMGIAVIVNVRHFLGILAGIGLIGVGIMVFIFLVKFLFAVNRFDRSGSVQVTEEEQPELFSFIRQVTKDTQTPFPKKIYLSADVNACVFYDSSFWSMFLPVKKNLQIGLGLVNSLNVSEFKAVMAHEFGHFSQRSMKLGSFVYNVNKIIHNMLFQNSSYTDFLNGWASIHGIFALFAGLTARIAQGIQWVLRKMYGVINKSYMGLSREMEFHADAVAASVSGSNSLITALRRIELADEGYSVALQKCDDLFKEKKITANIFDNHRSVLFFIAKEYRLSIDTGLPVVTDEFLVNKRSSRINFKDQWASHPTSAEREENLRRLGIAANTRKESAWDLFRDKETLQLQLTQKIYGSLELGADTITINEEDFDTRLNGDAEQFTLPEVYQAYYDNRQIAIPGEGILQKTMEEQVPAKLEDLFSPATISLPKNIAVINQDIALLNAFNNDEIHIKTFDFDGKKYKRSEAASLITQLQNEVTQKQEALEKQDLTAIAFFLTRARAESEAHYDRLQQLYDDYFHHRQKAADLLEKINGMLALLAPIYNGQATTLEGVTAIINRLKSDNEPAVKEKIQEWLALGLFNQDAVRKAATEKFIASHYEYFSGDSFFENELAELNQLCMDGWNEVSMLLFRKFKHILTEQLPLVKTGTGYEAAIK